MRKNNQMLWVIILFTLAFIMGNLLYTENILLFLSPRMLPVAFFGFCVLLILFLFNVWKLFSTSEKGESTFRLSYLMFFIPIILFVTSTPDAETINQLPNQSVSISYGANTNQKDNKSTDMRDEYVNADSPHSTPKPYEQKPDVFTTNAYELPPCVIEDGNWQDQPEDEFRDCLYYDPEYMWGVEVTVHGFVMKDEDFPEDVIIVARNIVSCCVADSYPAGFAVKVVDEDEFEEDEWIVVTGFMDGIKMESYGKFSDFPIITDGIIIRRDAMPLKEQYVYP